LFVISVKARVVEKKMGIFNADKNTGQKKVNWEK
jgi:hypothetical protein